MEEIILLDTKRKCFVCLSPLNTLRMLQNLEKLFLTLHLNYAEIVKIAGGVQLERMILDGVANHCDVRLCNSCAASLEELSKAERALLQGKSNMEKIFKDLLVVDRSNALQAMQIAQLYSKACEEVLVEEGQVARIRGGICKEIVKALEDEAKLENFKKEKPSNAWGYLVEALVLNLRLELSKKCKACLTLQSDEAQAVPSSQPDTFSHSPISKEPVSEPNSEMRSPVPLSSTPLDSPHSNQQSSSSSAPPTLQTFEETEINGDNQASNSPPILHLQSKNPTAKSSTNALKTKTDKEMGAKEGFDYKSRQHFHIHSNTHFTCRYCQAELTAGKSVRGKAWHHFFRFHFEGQKTHRKPSKKKATLIAAKILKPQIGKGKGIPTGGKRGWAFKYREHFNCQGISSFECKHCFKSYVGKDVRRAARVHFLRKHSSQENGAPQSREATGGNKWLSPAGFVFKASDHFNFQGKTLCVCKYCPQTYSGAYCGQAGRLHFLRRHYEEWKKMNQESSSRPSSHQSDSAGQERSRPEQATTSTGSIFFLKITEGKAAAGEEMNEKDVSQDGSTDNDSLPFSPLSIAEVDTPDSLTAEERQESDFEPQLNKIIHFCGICGEKFESQSDADKHFGDKHRELV